MSMSLNIHGVERIELGAILDYTITDGSVFYNREINLFDKNGNKLMCITPYATNGHNLLIEDKILDDMKLPFELKAA